MMPDKSDPQSLNSNDHDLDDIEAGLQVAIEDEGSGGGSYDASAAISVDINDDLEIISLSAGASATAPAPEPPSGGVGAFATVRWRDRLRIQNPDYFRPYAGLTFFYFKPHISGQVTGELGHADFSVALWDAASGELRAGTRLDFTEPGSYDKRPGLSLNTNIFENIAGDMAEVDFQMMLHVRASSLPGGVTQHSSADFTHTASLGPIYIADANGNYVPGSEHIQLVGSSGIVYRVEPLPTPLAADFDNDGDVDGDDRVQWQGDFGQNGESDADADGDSDGDDFLAWQRQLGSGAPAPSQAVPEPGALPLLLVSGLVLATARRRRGNDH
jgi:hypothetical protein